MITRERLIELIRAHASWHNSADAESLLTTIEAAGCVVVPRDADLNMLNAGWDKMFGPDAGPTSIVWEAMLAASPFAPGEKT